MDTMMQLDEMPRTPPRNKVFPFLMPPRPLSIEVEALLEKEAVVLSPTGPRTRSPSVTPMSRLPTPTAEELLLREQMDQLMLDVANKSQERGLSMEDAFPDDAAKLTKSELADFLTRAGLEQAEELADTMVDGCKKYVGDRTPTSPSGLKVHTLKQALRVAVAKSLRPRSRSSCHSSPSTRPNSRLASPISAHVAPTPTLPLIEENPQPLRTISASPDGVRKKLGRTRFGRSPGSASPPSSQQCSPEAVDENRPISPPRAVKREIDDEQFACENGVPVQKKETGHPQKDSAVIGSPPKQPFLELRDLNTARLPGFISQVAVTQSAKLHLAAGPSAFGNGTTGNGADLLTGYGFPGIARVGKRKVNRRKYRQVLGTEPSSEASEAAVQETAPQGAQFEATEGPAKTPPVSPLNFLMKAMALTNLWQRDTESPADTEVVDGQ